MKLRAVVVLLLPLAFAISAHASSDAKATPTPGFLDKSWGKTLEILHLRHAAHSQTPPPQIHHQIELKLDLSPSPVQLSANREIKVIVSLFNRSKKYVHLDFPTSQRIEILVRDASGKVVNTWSEDQSFTNDPAAVTVNPGERLEYTASVATREMTADQPYVIEASFPSYPELKIQQQVTPKK
jgi:hypothetical protein